MKVIINKYLLYPILIFIFILFSFYCYEKNIVFIYCPKYSIGTIYNFVWTVIMVFSFDIAINQFVSQKSINKRNVYLGIKTLPFFDNWYNIGHKFLYSMIFTVDLLYFIIAPFIIFGKKYSTDTSIWLFIWQTSYIIVLGVLLILIISDFDIIHFMHMISTRSDESRIKSYVIYMGRKKLRYDIKKGKKDNKDYSFIQFIKKLIKNTYNLKRSDHVATLETFQLMYLMSKVLSNCKYSSYERYIDSIDKIYTLINQFVDIVLKYFNRRETHHIKSYHRYTIKHVKLYKFWIIKQYTQLIDNLLYNLKTHKIKTHDAMNLFPYKLINKKFIHHNRTWIKFNELFSKEKFIKFSRINLQNFKYSPDGYNDRNHEIIQNNAKKFINCETSYLYNKYCYDIMPIDVVNSLKSLFPKFLGQYIVSNEFKKRVKGQFTRTFLKQLEFIV